MVNAKEIYRTEHLPGVTDIPHLVKVFTDGSTVTSVVFCYVYDAIHRKRKQPPFRFISIKTMGLEGAFVGSNNTYENVDLSDCPEHYLAAEYREWEATIVKEKVA